MSTSSLNESFGEQKLLEIFLRGTKLMKIVEEKTEQFINTYASSKKPEDAKAAIILKLDFNYKDLTQRSPTLLQLVLEEPVEFLDTTKYLLYSLVTSILKSSDTAPTTIDADQIHLQLRFFGLPVEKELLFSPSAPGGLSIVKGVLSAYSEPIDYTQFGTAALGVRQTASSQILRIVCHQTREMCDLFMRLFSVPNCYKCTRPLIEYTQLRSIGSRRFLKIFPIESVSTPRVFNRVFRCQVIRLNDYTYDCDLILGAQYIVTGHLDFQTLEFIAWNLQKQ